MKKMKTKDRLELTENLLREAYKFIRKGACTQSNIKRVELEDKIHSYFYEKTETGIYK